MHYGGMKHIIENPTRGLIVPTWATKLEWTEGPLHQQLPRPIIEITHDEWYRQGICSPYGVSDSYYESCWLPDSPHSEPDAQGYQKWLEPQWACYIDIYHTHALVTAKQFSWHHDLPNQREPNQGLGIFVPSRNHTNGRAGYTLRFYRMGCDHNFVDAGQSSMCYHSRICTMCGLRDDIDSSG